MFKSETKVILYYRPKRPDCLYQSIDVCAVAFGRVIVMLYTATELGLFVADALWNLYVLFPVLVVFWSGTWDLVDIYMDGFFVDQPFSSNAMSMIVGGNIQTIGYFVIPLLKDIVRPSFSTWSPRHVVVSRVSMYICTIGNVVYWRGVWNIIYLLIGNDVQTAATMTLVAFALLFLLKSTASAIGCPFGLSVDTDPNFYQTFPRFRQQIDAPILYVLDVLFSVYVLNTLNVVIWAGFMKLGDELILPDDNIRSRVVSLGAGCGLSFLLFALMLPHRAALDRIAASDKSLLAYLFEITFNVFTTIVVLLLWRGLWGLAQNQLTHFSNREAVDWICHSVGFFAMLCLQVAGFFRGVGCVVDGERCFADWPMEYFIVLYRRRQNEQMAYQYSLDAESDVSSEQPLLPSTMVNGHYQACTRQSDLIWATS